MEEAPTTLGLRQIQARAPAAPQMKLDPHQVIGRRKMGPDIAVTGIAPGGFSHLPLLIHQCREGHVSAFGHIDQADSSVPWPRRRGDQVVKGNGDGEG